MITREAFVEKTQTKICSYFLFVYLSIKLNVRWLIPSNGKPNQASSSLSVFYLKLDQRKRIKNRITEVVAWNNYFCFKPYGGDKACEQINRYRSEWFNPITKAVTKPKVSITSTSALLIACITSVLRLGAWLFGHYLWNERKWKTDRFNLYHRLKPQIYTPISLRRLVAYSADLVLHSSRRKECNQPPKVGKILFMLNLIFFFLPPTKDFFTSLSIPPQWKISRSILNKNKLSEMAFPCLFLKIFNASRNIATALCVLNETKWNK